MPVHTITDSQRALHLRWLLELTQIPTAAGREHRVIEWIRHWTAERAGLVLREDSAGNLEIVGAGAQPASARPMYFTAHLDHPAFVVERIVAPGVLELSFRGGVMEDYFTEARVVVHPESGGAGPMGAVIRSKLEPAAGEKPGPFTHYLAELDDNAAAESVAVGAVATWHLPPAEIKDGIVHTSACDDLAAAAAALAAIDVLLGAGNADSPSTPARRPAAAALPRLLFTRAEEIGFIGAIAACRAPAPTMPKNSRVVALENSRSFSDSPIGGGPIVRVGDRLSVFSPSLTDAIAKRAEQISGAPASPTASQKLTDGPKWKWQRKLMPGGACEASVFCAAGYEATCLCLPLGNYHNMADLEAVQAGTTTAPARVGREYISVADFNGLVDLLVACAEGLPEVSPMMERMEKLWAERSFVLGTPGR